MRRPGEVLSRLQLLERAWDYGYENRSNVVDVYVRYLREKIDRPFGVASIETVRGDGYRLREDGGALTRLPLRVRLTLAFALVMAVVLALDRDRSSTCGSAATSTHDRPGPRLALGRDRRARAPGGRGARVARPR